MGLAYEAATALRGMVLVLPWLAALFVADVALSLLLPVSVAFPDVAYDVSSSVAGLIWRWIQLLFERCNGAVIGVSGDALPAGESAVVVCNHVGWSDFYMIQALAVRAGMLGRCRYLAKIELRRVPFLGWGLWALGMPMVSRNWLRDQGELDRAFKGILTRRWPTWLISFSEATRFTPAKYEESRKFTAAHGKPQPQHLLYPRTRGFVATVRSLRKAPQVKAVYDLAVAYEHDGIFGDAPSMWDTLRLPGLSVPSRAARGVGKGGGGQGYRFHVHVRRFPLEDLPDDDAGLAAFLERLWLEKGEFLEAKRREWQAEAKRG